MFVPPWNRIDDQIKPILQHHGITTLSTFGPRKCAKAHGLQIVNTHIDPIDWRRTRDLVEPEILNHRIVTLLDDRVEGRADPSEPLGLLTHHLVHTEQIWRYSIDIMTLFLDAGATPWEGLA